MLIVKIWWQTCPLPNSGPPVDVSMEFGMLFHLDHLIDSKFRQIIPSSLALSELNHFRLSSFSSSFPPQIAVVQQRRLRGGSNVQGR
jgi:hypothetical protein